MASCRVKLVEVVSRTCSATVLKSYGGQARALLIFVETGVQQGLVYVPRQLEQIQLCLDILQLC